MTIRDHLIRALAAHAWKSAHGDVMVAVRTLVCLTGLDDVAAFTLIEEVIADNLPARRMTDRELGERIARDEMEKAHRLIEAGYSDQLDKVIDGEIDIDTACQIFDGRRHP